MNTLLRIKDPQIYNLIQKEFSRQKRGLELIASEKFYLQIRYGMSWFNSY